MKVKIQIINSFRIKNKKEDAFYNKNDILVVSYNKLRDFSPEDYKIIK